MATTHLFRAMLALMLLQTGFVILEGLMFSLFVSDMPWWQVVTIVLALFGASLLAFVAAFILMWFTAKAKSLSRARVVVIRAISIGLLIVAVGMALPTFIYSMRLVTHRYNDVQVFALGSQYHTTQRVFIRSTNGDATVEYTTLASYRADPEAGWVALPAISLLEDHDWTGVVDITGLAANEHYVVRLKVAGQVRPAEEFLHFKTLSTGPHGKFAFGSCILPWWSGVLTGYGAFSQVNADFIVFLGDFIYADHPMWYGGDVSSYDTFYREVYSDQFVRNVSRQLPIFHMYDDHEWIDNLFEKQGPNDAIFLNAMTSWEKYTGAANPPSLGGEANMHWYNFSASGADFFVWETRGYRSLPYDSDPMTPGKTILGPVQKAQFFAWLRQSQATFKFIATTYPFTMNTGDEDNWYGYQIERQEILDYIATNNITGVVFYSADRHWSGVFEVAPGIIEVVSSPVDAFTGAVSSSTKNGPDPVYFTAGGENYIATFEWEAKASPPRLEVELFRSKPDVSRLFAQRFNLVAGKLQIPV